ncbi:MAG: ABC transporter permease [archaeon]
MIKLRRQLAGFFFRQTDLTRKYWAWEIVFLFYDIIIALSVGLIGYGINSVTNLSVNSAELTLFLVIGSFMWTYLASMFWVIGSTVQLERWEGTIEYTFMAPVKRSIQLTSTIIYAFILGITKFLIVLVLVSFFFNISLASVNIVSVIVIMFFSSIAFVGLGIIAATLPLLSTEEGEQAVDIFEGILLFVSGIFYPITVLPEAVQLISKISPATYALQGMREAIINNATVSQLFSSDIMPLIVISIVLLPLSLYIFGLIEKHAKKAGKLARTG